MRLSKKFISQNIYYLYRNAPRYTKAMQSDSFIVFDRLQCSSIIIPNISDTSAKLSSELRVFVVKLDFEIAVDQ